MLAGVLAGNLMAVSARATVTKPAALAARSAHRSAGPTMIDGDSPSFGRPTGATRPEQTGGVGLPPAPGGRLTRISPAGGAIALTFDDGPDPRWTGQVLALLAQYRMHATFCLIGTYARKYPALVRQIVARGNSLCDHTFTHDEHVGSRPVLQIRAQLESAYAAITAASGGVPPRYFRAPAGRWTPALLSESRAEGMTPLGWSVDPRDWARPGTPAITAAVLRSLKPGSIVLMHDGYGRRDQSVAALRQMLPVLVARRLHSVAL
ncbi:MAG: polysaccharide deacetylase family protein [Actinomycetota bacterium]|nr:polysaccharide deacetylase family protein [Actinomycetota bacterium]